MTLDEAIIHAEEVANTQCDDCAKEHKQLAEWLKELKNYREEKNKSSIELTKEELLVLIEGLDYQQDMSSVIFEEYSINGEELSKKLNKVFYNLDWSK